mmetsp:Transcript_31332/g.81357  ORF Transcript_31332/g.81357 Transcript_31332/m.81357 type:complete len:390 (-) Transcript_31332:155-1324(-)
MDMVRLGQSMVSNAFSDSSIRADPLNGVIANDAVTVAISSKEHAVSRNRCIRGTNSRSLFATARPARGAVLVAPSRTVRRRALTGEVGSNPLRSRDTRRSEPTERGLDGGLEKGDRLTVEERRIASRDKAMDGLPMGLPWSFAVPTGDSRAGSPCSVFVRGLLRKVSTLSSVPRFDCRVERFLPIPMELFAGDSSANSSCSWLATGTSQTRTRPLGSNTMMLVSVTIRWATAASGTKVHTPSTDSCRLRRITTISSVVPVRICKHIVIPSQLKAAAAICDSTSDPALGWDTTPPTWADKLWQPAAVAQSSSCSGVKTYAARVVQARMLKPSRPMDSPAAGRVSGLQECDASAAPSSESQRHTQRPALATNWPAGEIAHSGPLQVFCSPS